MSIYANEILELFLQREIRFNCNAHGMATRMMARWADGDRGRQIRDVVKWLETKGLAE